MDGRHFRQPQGRMTDSMQPEETEMEEKIMVTRSSMPEFGEYMEEIREIWDSRWLTNMGVKHRELQEGLREYLGVENVELLSNGHMALELTLQAMNLQGEEQRAAAAAQKRISVELLVDMMRELAACYEEAGEADRARREREKARSLIGLFSGEEEDAWVQALLRETE